MIYKSDYPAVLRPLPSLSSHSLHMLFHMNSNDGTPLQVPYTQHQETEVILWCFTADLCVTDYFLKF